MHCSADLSDSRAAADADGDRRWDRGRNEAAGIAGSSVLLDPDGLVDDTLTVLVGIIGGLIVGVVATVVLVILTGSGLALPVGVVGWLGATAYLVRRRTVQGAIAATGYAVALVLLAVPVIALSPAIEVEGGIVARGGTFVGLLIAVAVPAGLAAGVGWVASRYVPDGASGSDG